MGDNQEQINRLLEKLNILVRRHDDFSKEIDSLRLEITRLKLLEQQRRSASQPKAETAETVEITKSAEAPNIVEKSVVKQHPQPAKPETKPPKRKSEFEKFIGENLISKIGIAITVIGVSIGVKYSIENDLISPLTRIVLGYLFGFALLIIGIKLKSKYEGFSAVLVSGSIAIMYFITYSAYTFYDLLPQLTTFILMVVFTVFSVIAALHYNQQVIALIGLVGAYAVPFLLSDGSGRANVLFTYIAIINAGILVIAKKNYWKILYYGAFLFTWLTFAVWYVFDYDATRYFGSALIFSSIYFVLFYLTFLGYKLLKKEKFNFGDIILLILNSFIYFGLAYNLLDLHKTGVHFIGLFTLANALVHFIVSTVVYRQKLVDRNLFYLTAGLALVFVTIAIPVQLDGSWVTLLWAGEAALSFWIGRTRNVVFFERLSYILMILATISIAHDWSVAYNAYNPAEPRTRLTPLINIHFLSSLLFVSAFGFMSYINRKIKTPMIAGVKKPVSVISYLIPVIFIFSLYYAFQLEISNYWDQLYKDSSFTISLENTVISESFSNYDFYHFQTMWIINYSLLFVSVLMLINKLRIKERILALATMGLMVLAIGAFLTEGLLSLSALRDSYLSRQTSQYYTPTLANLTIRYISYIFVVLGIVMMFHKMRRETTLHQFYMPFIFFVHITALWILSSELINWMDIANSTQSYKLGLSILWGVYSLFLIILGIRSKNAPLRIGAIVLFGVTLLKLFFYDISHLTTIAKTIVFVSLGVMLLIISFLYNKYKHLIADENET